MQILPIGDPHVRDTMIAFEQALYGLGRSRHPAVTKLIGAGLPSAPRIWVPTRRRRDRSQKMQSSGQVEAANRVQVGPVVVVSGDAGGRR